MVEAGEMNNFRNSRLGKIRQYAISQVSRVYDGSPILAKRLTGWKQRNSQNAVELDAAVDLWSQLEQLSDAPEIVEWCNVDKIERGGAITRRAQAIAASLILGVMSALAVWWLQPFSQSGVDVGSNELTRYMTQIGERKKIALSDGSVITLNTDSHLVADFNAERRRVVLDRGEAYFDIAKESNRPFTIDLGSRAITVLGTEFNVRKVRSQLSIAVVEGMVVVHRKEKLPSTIFSSTRGPNSEHASQSPDQYQLKSGDVITVDNDSWQTAKLETDSESSRRASWRSGKVWFYEQPLYKVVQEMNRYTKRKVLIEDADIMNLKVTAVLHLDELDAILVGLEASLPININSYPGSIVIVGDNKGRRS